MKSALIAPRRTPSTLLFLIGLLLACGSHLPAGETKAIDLKEVPAPVLAAAKDVLPEVTFTRAQTETESDGTVVYEIIGTTKEGKEIEIDIFDSGEFEEYEMILPEEAVPGAILVAIRSAYPGIEVRKIEASYTATHKIFQYEVVGVYKNETIDLETNANGSRITLADD